MSTPTPETDANLCCYDHPAWPGGRKFTVNGHPVVPADFARKLERERDQLARWKQEAIFVRDWWQDVDEFVRKHPDCTLGDTVAHAALRMLKERDEFSMRLEDALSDKVKAQSGNRTLMDENGRLRAEIAKLNADYLQVMVERDNLRASIGVVESWMPKPPQNLREDIIRAINCRSAESGSDTPDWILGNFLMASLAAFDVATNERTSYFRRPDDAPIMDLP